MPGNKTQRWRSDLKNLNPTGGLISSVSRLCRSFPFPFTTLTQLILAALVSNCSWSSSSGLYVVSVRKSRLVIIVDVSPSDSPEMRDSNEESDWWSDLLFFHSLLSDLPEVFLFLLPPCLLLSWLSELWSAGAIDPPGLASQLTWWEGPGCSSSIGISSCAAGGL